jgi:hypothetical protein
MLGACGFMCGYVCVWLSTEIEFIGLDENDASVVIIWGKANIFIVCIGKVRTVYYREEGIDRRTDEYSIGLFKTISTQPGRPAQ